MLKENARFFTAGLAGVEQAILTVSFVLAHQVTWYQVAWRRGADFAERYALKHTLESYLPLLLVGMCVLGFHSLWSRSRRLRPVNDEINEVVTRTVAIAVSTIAAIFLLRLDADSRIFVGIWCTILLLGQVSLRVSIRMALREARSRGYNTRNVAIVGTTSMAQRVADSIKRHEDWGIRLVGFIARDTVALPTSVEPVIGTLDEVAKLVDNQVIDEVIFCAESGSLQHYEEALISCEEAGVNTRLVLDFFPHKFSTLELEDLEGFPMLTFHTTTSDPLPLFTKRLFDLVVASSALLFGAPIFLLVALSIRISSDGPVFFVQRRVGLNGREFDLYKFRSMVVDAESQKTAMLALNERNGPAFKMANDPRVTNFGSFLRKTSLDEIPQFWNVLVGDMSIVGPRPPIPSEVSRYERWQRRRLSVKPGITCTWQVANRDDSDFERWMEHDLAYIDNWSFWLDLRIFLLTIPAVLLRRGAS